MPDNKEEKTSISYQEMCAAILASSKCPPELKVRYPTAQALFDASPTGELWYILPMYIDYAEQDEIWIKVAESVIRNREFEEERRKQEQRAWEAARGDSSKLSRFPGR